MLRVQKLIPLSSFLFLILISFDARAQSQGLTEAQAVDQVVRLYSRLAGTPPTAAKLTQLVPSMRQGNPAPTVFSAMDENSFYTQTIVRIFSPFGNPEGRVEENLTDFTATIVGLIQDNQDFRDVISGDVIYTGNNEVQSYDIQVFPPLGNAQATANNCPLNIRTQERNAHSGAFADEDDDPTVQRRICDLRIGNCEPGHDPRYDPYYISVNAGGYIPAIPETTGLDEGGTSRTIPAQAMQVSGSIPSAQFPLFRGRGYGNNDANSAQFNLTYSLCHGWNFDQEPDFNATPARVRQWGIENGRTGNTFNLEYRLIDGRIRHYEDLGRYDNWNTMLRQRSQSALYSSLRDGQNGRQNGGASEWDEDVAGVLTTMKGGQSYFTAGTNRKSIALTFQNWLGFTMEQLHDPNVNRQYIRQDLKGETNCAGCHSKMDAAANATNRLDFTDNRLVYNFGFPGNPNKLFRGCSNPNDPNDCVNPNGFNPRNLPQSEQNSWWNLATVGRNAFLGWRAPSGQSMTSGVGYRSLMRVYANTEAFSNRMAQLAMTASCGRKPTPNELDELANTARAWEQGLSNYESNDADNPYNMRGLFAEASKYCFGRIEQ